MMRKLCIVLFIANLNSTINPDTLSALSKNIESIKCRSAEYMQRFSDAKNVIEENKFLYIGVIACTVVVKLEQILDLLETGPVSEATYKTVSNILRGSDPENISSNSLIGAINKNMQEYMDPKLIEDICAFMLYIDDVFHMYNSDFYYKLWVSKFPGDDRHGVLESLKLIRDDLQQRFDLKQKPNYQVLLNGLHYFEQYFVKISYIEMYWGIHQPQILMKQLKVMAKLYNNQECIKKIENLALYKESLANSCASNLFFNYIVNTYLLNDCMNKLWPDMSSEFYNCGNFMLYFGILVNAYKMFYVMEAVFSRECAHKILMRITNILAILKILEINYSVQPDINITTLDFLKFCFLNFMYYGHFIDGDYNQSKNSCLIKPLFSGLSGLYMILNYWNMMPEWPLINFLLLYFYYMSIENQMKYVLRI